MGTSKDLQTQAVLDRAASSETGSYEWWTALSFEEGDVALESDPLVTGEAGVDELELRLYSL